MDKAQDFIIVVRAVLYFYGKIILVKRKRDNTHSPGVWELPGGKITKADFDSWRVSGSYLLINALLRGIRAETGLEVSVDELPFYIWTKQPEKEGRYSGKAELVLFYAGSGKEFRPRCGENVEQIYLSGFTQALRMKDISEADRKAILKTRPS